MRIFLIIILLLSSQTQAPGQTVTPKTELFIIGTKHDGNKKFNQKELYKFIEKLKPDIILWEQNIKFKRVFGLRTASFLKIWKPSIEQLALQKYSNRRKEIKIYPFDTTIASRHNYIKKYIKFQSLFFDSLSKAKKSLADSVKYAEYLTKRNYYYGLVETETLEKLNNPNIFNLAKEIFNKDEALILPLSKQYLKDISLIDNFVEQNKFWILRNNFMVQQIKKYSIEYQGKRIIILTGLNHKYYLVEKLSSENNSNLILKNIDDN